MEGLSGLELGMVCISSAHYEQNSFITHVSTGAWKCGSAMCPGWAEDGCDVSRLCHIILWTLYRDPVTLYPCLLRSQHQFRLDSVSVQLPVLIYFLPERVTSQFPVETAGNCSCL